MRSPLKGFSRVLAALFAAVALLTSSALAETRPPIAAMADGGLCLITDSAGSYRTVVSGGGVSRVPAESLTLPLDSTAYLNRRTSPLLSSPWETAEPLLLLRRGAAVTLTGLEGEWCSVRFAGVSGYLPADVLVLRSGDVERPGGEAMVELAMQYLDFPYVYGSKDAERGFDCSGFVCYLSSAFGFTTWRTAADIYKNDGVPVGRDELSCGDLVFFHSNTETVGHVGIFIEGDVFIHASSGAKRVIISSLENDYYARNYVGAKRFFTNK